MVGTTYVPKFMLYYHFAHIKLKELFEEPRETFWTFKSFSDQLDPFWLFRESHSEELGGIQNGSPGDPLKYRGMAPSREPFGSSSFICVQYFYKNLVD